MTEHKEEALERKTKNIYEQMCRMIGSYIHHVREEKGISLRDMYRRTNISIAVLSEIENSQKLPRIESLIKLAIALDIPMSDIFGSKCYADFTLTDIKPFSKLKEEFLKSPFPRLDLNKDEMKEIADFMEYIKFKRNKKNRAVDNSKI